MNLITIIRVFESFHGGKKFWLNDDNQIEKEPGSIITVASATTTEVKNQSDFKELIQYVSDDESLCLILGYPKDVKVNEDYFICSVRYMEEKLDGNINEWYTDDEGRKYICRLKDNFLQSNWIVFDKDSVKGMPKELDFPNYKTWWSAMIKLYPPLKTTGVVVTPSNSCRLLVDGNPYKTGNYHAYCQVKNAQDVERFGKTLFISAFNKEFGFMSEIKNGKRPWTIFDPTTFSRERLIYEGKPIVEEPLAVAPLEMHCLKGGLLDTEQLSSIEHKEAEGIKLTKIKGELTLECKNLTWDLEIETKDHGKMTVGYYYDNYENKLRIQSPFRPDSESFAAYIRKHESSGNPFIYDVGIQTKYVLQESKRIRIGENKESKKQEKKQTKEEKKQTRTKKEIIANDPYETTGLNYPPGKFGDLCKDIYQTAPHPNKEASIITAVVMVAGITGRKFNVLGTGLNVYAALLADSGFGKAIVKDTISHTLRSEADNLLGGTYKGNTRFTGPKAIHMMLVEGLSRICVLEESGLMQSSKAGDQSGLQRILLDIYTSSGKNNWAFDEGYSDFKLDALPCPALSICHVSTPASYIAALEAKNSIASGEIARVWTIRLHGEKTLYNRQRKETLSESSLKRLKQLMKLGADRQKLKGKEGKVIDIEVSNELLNYSDEYTKRENEYRKLGNTLKATICSRAFMKVLKLASISSIYNGKNEIGKDEFEWSMNCVESELISIEIAVESDSDNMEKVITYVVAPVIIKMISGKYRDKKICPSVDMRKEKLFTLSHIKQALRNNPSLKKFDDNISNGRGFTGLEKALNYLCRNGYLTRLTKDKDVEADLMKFKIGYKIDDIFFSEYAKS